MTKLCGSTCLKIRSKVRLPGGYVPSLTMPLYRTLRLPSKAKAVEPHAMHLPPLTHRGKASMLQVHEKRTSSSPAMIERRYRCTRKGSRRSGAIIFCGFAAEAIFLSSRKSHALKTHGRGGESSTTVCAISGAHKFRPSGQPGPRSMGKRRTSTA